MEKVLITPGNFIISRSCAFVHNPHEAKTNHATHFIISESSMFMHNYISHALRQIISLSHFIILQCSAFTHNCNYIDANKICSVVNKLFCKTHFVFFTVTNLLLVLSNSVKWLCDLASLYWIQMHLLLRY